MPSTRAENKLLMFEMANRGLSNLIFFFTLPLVTSPLLFFGKEFQFLWIYVLYALFIMVEPIPLVATALLPLFLLPICAITTARQTAMAYFFDTTPFVLTCFILALAVEETGLHRRVALTMMRFAGSKKRNILIANTLSTTFISMFITDLPVLTVVISVVYEISRTLIEAQNKCSSNSSSSSLLELKLFEEKIDLSKLSKEDANFCKAMMFCGPVAAVIGGRITLPGSVMNFIIKDVIKVFYRDHDYISYSTWLLMSLPAAPLQLLVTVIVVTICFLGPKELLCYQKKNEGEEAEQGEMLKEVIRGQYLQLGRISFAEGSVMFLMLVCVAAWFFRCPDFMHGWSELLPDNGSFVTDTTVSIMVCILFFVWPKTLKCDGWAPILTLENMAKLPWAVILLVGSTFAITEGIKDSGFVNMLACAMTEFLKATSPVLLQLLAMAISMFDCGGANMIWTPIFLGIANQKEIPVHPFYFSLPIVFTAGSQFVLPNSIVVLIVLQTKVLTIRDLIIPGGLIQLIFAAITLLQFNTWAYWLLDLQVVPEANGLQFNCSHG